jgi:hypothetical protein
MRLLARDPADRYRSAAALVEELGRVRHALPPAPSSGDEPASTALADATTLALKPVASGSTNGTHGWRSFWVLMACAVLVIALGLLGWSLLRGPRPSALLARRGVQREDRQKGPNEHRKATRRQKSPRLMALTSKWLARVSTMPASKLRSGPGQVLNLARIQCSSSRWPAVRKQGRARRSSSR